MFRLREVAVIVSMVACGSILYWPVNAQDAVPVQQQNSDAKTPDVVTAQPQNSDSGQAAPPAAQAAPAEAPNPKLMVTVGKSLIIDSPLNITRVHVANGAFAEAVAVNPKEVLINGTAPGETSLIVWQQNGNRMVYDLTVRMSGNRLESARQQIARDFPNDDINVTFENDTAFVRGTVKDVTSADRVMAVANTLGKSINLLRVDVPPVEPQVLLKVRFANVDRSTSLQVGLNLFNTSFNQQTSLGTGPALFPDDRNKIPVGQAVNLLFLRPDINLVAELQALQNKNLLEMLAEPNLLSISGESASFLAGGEFPFPVVQPSSGGGTSLAIMWREYGVRLNFTPLVTPRGTIRLKVNPEVSSLDYTNAVTLQGFTIPGLSSRRVQTEVELDSGQSFVIAGLLDNQTRDNLSKVPGISAIPILGKLFQSKNLTKTNSELLVIITPEVVRPVPAGQTLPELTMKNPFLPSNSNIQLRTPGMDKTGAVPIKPPVESLPYERLAQPPKQGQGGSAPNAMTPMAPAANPGTNPPAPPVPPAAGGSGK